MSDAVSRPPLPLAVPFRVGIVGGMGPMAGVYLQRLIIEATPAERDQDHFEVVCFTNPHVPERMGSLAEDGGSRYVAAVRASVALLVSAGATHIVIPCNTAHARLARIREGVAVPVLDMVELAARALVEHHGKGRRVGLLATIGTLNERLYQRAATGSVAEWVLPDAGDQARVADAIHAVKIGKMADGAEAVVAVSRRLAARGAEILMVGCTELSMCHDALGSLGLPLVDPLRVTARALASLGAAIGRAQEAHGREE